MKKINIGLSACLAGDKVRYNGQDCFNQLINSHLAEYFEYTTVCPEIAIGMGTPRETIRIVKDGELQLRASKSNEDFTEKMRLFAISDMERIKNANLCGFIFKKGSPSCGAFRVKVYTPEGMPLVEKTSGFYAAQVMKSLPWLPVEEEGRLNDARLFENFIQRVFALGRWQEMMQNGLTHKALLDFHQFHKYWIMAHNQLQLKKLGSILANRKNRSVEELARDYLELFTSVVSKPPRSSNHINVLHHLLGYFKKSLDSFDKKEMLTTIEHYRKSYVPLILPVSRLAFYAKKYQQKYLLNQSYLHYPENLGLLNKL